jgi:hypothetical protein
MHTLVKILTTPQAKHFLPRYVPSNPSTHPTTTKTNFVLLLVLARVIMVINGGANPRLASCSRHKETLTTLEWLLQKTMAAAREELIRLVGTWPCLNRHGLTAWHRPFVHVTSNGRPFVVNTMWECYQRYLLSLPPCLVDFRKNNTKTGTNLLT